MFKHKLSFMITSIPFFRQTVYQWRHHHKNIDPVHTWHKTPLISVGWWNFAYGYKHFPWSPVQQSICKKLLSHILHYHGVVAKPLGHFPRGVEAAHSNLSPALCNPLASPLPGATGLKLGTGRVQRTWHAGKGRRLQHSSLSPAPALWMPHSYPAPGAAKHNADCFVTCFRLQKVAFIRSFIPSQINND